MLLEELLKTERNEGKEEERLEGKLKGKLEVLLENLGSLPPELSSRIEEWNLNSNLN